MSNTESASGDKEDIKDIKEGRDLNRRQEVYSGSSNIKMKPGPLWLWWRDNWARENSQTTL